MDFVATTVLLGKLLNVGIDRSLTACIDDNDLIERGQLRQKKFNFFFTILTDYQRYA
jgi:hypothetical protein